VYSKTAPHRPKLRQERHGLEYLNHLIPSPLHIKHAAANEPGRDLPRNPLYSNGFIGTSHRPPGLFGSPDGAWTVRRSRLLQTCHSYGVASPRSYSTENSEEPHYLL
jgi:hypothetical protein